ncbi:Pyridoxal kinase PdxY [invertebrate metagenome]|uniref:pyridoxal kinase n=1 Tax=invertebrate metagenome TaxID=1711999 RepID=A0A2H9TAE7_9ZZZZ
MNILSVQSHVAYGHAGNAAAIFPLQRTGVNVWPVHTVMVSNHGGYPTMQGTKIAPAIVGDVIDGIRQRGVLPDCDALLTGYLGSAGMASVIKDTIETLRTVNPAALFCCDPVCGDTDRGVTVSPEIPNTFKNKLLPLADITTPNHFELELLTGCSVSSLDDALTAAQQLQSMGPKIVLVTSLNCDSTQSGTIDMLAVSPQGTWIITTPYVPFTTLISGTGDITSALFLASILKKQDINAALEYVASVMFSLLQKTAAAHSQELIIIDAQEEFIHPSHTFRAKLLHV